MGRRRVMIAAIAAATVGWMDGAAAQGYPDRIVELAKAAAKTVL